MIKGNKATRDFAIPFVSNYIEATDLSRYGSGALAGPEFIDAPYKTAVIPMTQPEKADIVEAYLFMEMTAPSDIPLGVKIGIGTFADITAGPLILPNLVYSNGYINEMHRRITGQDESLSVAANGTLTVDVDLTRVIPKRGDPTYLSDGFVLLVTFDVIPLLANGYSLDKFKLSCTAQMGFGT